MRSSKTCMKKWDHSVLIIGFATSLLLILMVMSMPRFLNHHQESAFKEEEQIQAQLKNNIEPSKGKDYPPIIAYWICGTKGDSKRMIRLLKAIYHPRNHYLLQLDAESSDHERQDLLVFVQSQNLFASFGNVDAVGKDYGVNKEGSSAVAATLHAAAILLKLNKNWDWFINLSPFDYPIVTQDDLLHGLSFLPRDVNFIHYFSKSDWEKRHDIDQVVIDPSLYLGKRSDLMYAVESRTKPDAFDIFAGSPWMILTRELAEYCVQGWENLPRKLLMFFNNVANPLHFYFQTVICNSPHFRYKTRVNIELIRLALNGNTGYDQMAASGAAFATPLKDRDYPVLDRIDKMMLNRSRVDRVVAGKWCSGSSSNGTLSSCSTSASGGATTDIDSLEAGPNGRKLAFLLSQLQFDAKVSINNPCIQSL